MKKTYTFHVQGMHCASCELLTERELGQCPGVTAVKANLSTRQVTVTADFGNHTLPEIAIQLSKFIKPFGYSLSLSPISNPNVHWSDFRLALPLAALFIVGFFLLQKIGLFDLVNITTLSPLAILILGFVASVSTCMATVGGLALSLSASYAKSGSRIWPQVNFHLGRLIGFLVLGGLIGIIGSSFRINPNTSLILGLFMGFVLLILGINLLDIFPQAAKLQLVIPKRLSQKVTTLHLPFLLGAATFFLPCGFTQSMQLYSLTSGSLLTGATTMFIFALGTLPVLAALSFGSVSLRTKINTSVFFKTAGLVVVFFALYNLFSGFRALGIINL